MRIIDADDIVYESIDSTVTGREESYYGTGILAVRKEDIDAMPTIELPERKKGKWKLLDNGDAICSECGRKQKCVWDFDNWDNFCRYCGSDMRGEQE